MFFDILATPRRTETFIRELPPVPQTGWRTPVELPELRGADWIGFDCETKETDFDHGPGWARGEGHIIGVSVAAYWNSNRRRIKFYFPLRHEVEREYNYADHATFWRWLKCMLETDIPKVGANLLYDCGWLSTENIYPRGMLYDVQFAEALIDEEGRTALDVLGHKYMQRGKLQDQCKEWVLKAYPTSGEKNWRGFLWRTPPRLVGPYAEDDADLPLDILWAQWGIMEREQTLNLFHMECKMIPLLVKMRQQGIPVDLAQAEVVREKVQREITEGYAKLKHLTGVDVDSVDAPAQLKKAFDAVGIVYPKTDKGSPSFKKEWLKLLSDDPERDPTGVGKLVNDIRERQKLRGTFIDSYILDRAKRDGASNSRGRIFCSFNPLRDDDGGAKTGRFSSSDPNLQNIPARTKIGKSVRTIFIPEYGHYCWHKKDHAQIEYRVFAHYAVGQGADEIKWKYINDPATDYHNATALSVAELRADKRYFLQMSAVQRAADAEWALFRKPMKNVNFGLLYGQTERSLAYKAGWSNDEAAKFFADYHGRLPFVRTTMQAIQNEVQQFGYVTTVMNRRTRFSRWEAKRYGDRDGRNYAYDDAIRKFGGNIRRAFAYRAVNYRFQGSAADVLKVGMVQLFEQGVLDYIGMPKLTVHDELDWSKINNENAMNEAFRYATHVLETALQLTVPLKVDSSEGATWADAA